jgi:citrate synthase
MSTYYPEAKDIFDEGIRAKQVLRLIAKTPTLAAYCHRFSIGMPTVYPDNALSYTENFLNMTFRVGDDYEVSPVLARALDVLFILHADHEQNCGTTAMRVVGSAHADPFIACSAAASALYGPLHGGANEAVVRMLGEIGSVDNVPGFIEDVKAGKGRLMGFGHRVYKNYDPRATIIKQTRTTSRGHGQEPAADTLVEEAALSDDYFKSRVFTPTSTSTWADPPAGLPGRHASTVLFAIPRTRAGWALTSCSATRSRRSPAPRQAYSRQPRDYGD